MIYGFTITEYIACLTIISVLTRALCGPDLRVTFVAPLFPITCAAVKGQIWPELAIWELGIGVAISTLVYLAIEGLFWAAPRAVYRLKTRQGGDR